MKLTLGGGYELVFTDTPAEIHSLLNRHAFRLVVWDIDQHDPSAPLKFLSNLDQPLDLQVSLVDCLEMLQAIRRAHPQLPVVLLAGEFEYDFQAAIVPQCHSVSFLTKDRPLDQLAERIQIILGDKKSSIREWILRIPEAGDPRQAGGAA